MYPNGIMLGENLGHQHMYVYIAHNPSHRYNCFKVGHSKNPSMRMKQLSGSHPEPFEIDYTIFTNDARRKENMTRDLLHKFKIKPKNHSSTEYLKVSLNTIIRVLKTVDKYWYNGLKSTETLYEKKIRLQHHLPKILPKYRYFRDLPPSSKSKLGGKHRSYALHPKYGPVLFEKSRKHKAVEQHGMYRGERNWGRKLPWQQTFRESTGFRIKPYTLKQPLPHREN